MPVKFCQLIIRFWFFLTYLITAVIVLVLKKHSVSKILSGYEEALWPKKWR